MNNKINLQITEYMFKVLRTMKHNISLSSENIHVTPVQYDALCFIKKHKFVEMHQISEYFSTTMPTATSLVDKLIGSKFAIRKNDPKDRRIVRISITNKGEKVISQAFKHRSLVMNKLLAYLSVDDKKDLLRIFQNIAEKSDSNEK
jgi:DNA-binding MarR family transcriptional regulator